MESMGVGWCCPGLASACSHLRAVARGGGWGVVWPSSSWSFSPSPSPSPGVLVAVLSLAPAPTWPAGVVVLVPSLSLLPSPCPSSSTSSTHNPPCEQWLTGLGAGAGSFVPHRWALGCSCHLGPFSWLSAAGHLRGLPPTLRAVARSGGGVTRPLGPPCLPVLT